jgi:hypothetical protein
MPTLTFYDSEGMAQARQRAVSGLSPFNLAGDTTQGMPDFPPNAHVLTTPITGFRGFDPVWAWKAWSSQNTFYDSYNHNLAAIPANPGILGWLFFHNYNGLWYRSQWYGEDNYPMWDTPQTIILGRAIAAAAYENWRAHTIFDDITWP